MGHFFGTKTQQERQLPLTNKVTNKFQCDLPGCEATFDYNPNPQPPEQWPAGIHARLTKVVVVTHALTNQPKFFCSDEHATEGIKRLIHLPALVHEAGTDAEVKAAVAGSNAVAQMKKPLVKP